ncbi:MULTISPECIES: HEPN domain-containing protein [unclassified Sporolactobacillus]|uniref:HEPN domain-containing protein n=1 Tax=unclassified Sporolactobacillus TaxID=2628533 RepID=UPI0023683DCC|nr:HEPN domain-containing protein [Sporolactobacillus sp. CQH2019]MDD9150481.1 HEPN domain-containing protein [Sporolactobacillus sp. CQH2019]
MSELQINTAIFPRVMSMSTKGSNDERPISIDLPRGANLLYLQGLKDKEEIKLLTKYANGEQLSDDDFKAMFKLFITNTPRLKPSAINNSNADPLNLFGVEIISNKGKIKFKLIDQYIPYIRVDTWEFITLDLLRNTYLNIINKYDFNGISIYLGSWKTETDEINQSLLNSLRSAFIFTIIGFLYGDNRHLYNSFTDYFNHEFSKRVSFINGSWKTKKPGEKIEYLPIFDSFYNLKGLNPKTLIEVIHAILDNEEIIIDDKEMIRNTLIDGAEQFHKNINTQGQLLEQSLIKPVVNYLIELETAADDLKAAKSLFEQRLYNPATNRCYYSMMHSSKALLEKKHMLKDWEPNVLNVRENHKQLEGKLKKLTENHILMRQFLSDFQYVKQKRWIADYEISKIDKVECNDCVLRAESFLSEVKRITM